jgi:O-antigen biosynthesis protein
LILHTDNDDKVTTLENRPELDSSQAQLLASYQRLIADLAAEKVQETLKLTEDVRSLNAHIHHLENIIQARDGAMGDLLAEQMQPAARLGRLIQKLAVKFFPLGSAREAWLSRALGVALRVHKYGPVGAVKMSLAARKNGHGLALNNPAGGNADQSSTGISDYAQWIAQNEPDADRLERQTLASEPYQPQAPLFSVILPIYKVPSDILKETIESVFQQTWKNWEICAVYADTDSDDNWNLLCKLAKQDPRLIIKRLASNSGISGNSNAALEMASGEFVALLDHDDTLTRWALHDMASRIREFDDCDFLFSDKDFLNAAGTLRQSPLFKPGWSPELLYTANYLTHFNVIRTSIVHAIGGWDKSTDGAQDWDLFFKATEKSRRIEHIKSIHYHWRIIAGSTASGVTAKPYAALGQLKAVENHVYRMKLPASVSPRHEGGFKLVWRFETQRIAHAVIHGVVSFDQTLQLISQLEQDSAGLVEAITLIVSERAHDAKFPQVSANGTPLRAIYTSASLTQTTAVNQVASSTKSAVLLLIDASADRLGQHTTKELIGWAGLHPEIGFASAVVFENSHKVIEAGRLMGSNCETHPLFRGDNFGAMSLLGGSHWYRNVSAAAPFCLAIKRSAWASGLAASGSLQNLLAMQFKQMQKFGLRGVVSPHARCFINIMPSIEDSPWHESMRLDPYFHPAFASANPVELALLK